MDDLPRIDFVVISHDHYDHLDEPTVRRLARLFDPIFVVPLGLRSWFADRGITNVVELDWGQSGTVKGLRIVCTPAQHGGGRTLVDQGRRLWASWAVLGSKRFYFAGDTGYYRHFKDIGDALGPFDLAALPIGSYTPREIARPVHISPEEALQAWTDLRATRFIGIHYGTFGLARSRTTSRRSGSPPRSSGATSTPPRSGSSIRASRGAGRPGPRRYSPTSSGNARMIRCGTTAHGSGRPAPGAIHPDAAEAQALGRAHVPLDVVADHPGVLGARGEGGEGVAVHRLLGLAAPELALDHHHVEDSARGRAARSSAAAGAGRHW